MVKVVLGPEAYCDEPKFRLVGDVVRERLEHDRITEPPRGARRLSECRDPPLARDRHAEGRQQPLRIVFVDGAPERPCRDEISGYAGLCRARAQRLSLHHISTHAVDRTEPLAGSADLHEAGIAQRFRLAQIHHSRPRTHEVMRLLRPLRGRDQHVHVLRHAPGMAKLTFIAGIRAIDDGRDRLAVVHDRHGVRNVDRVIAVAPGIEWISVAGDAADDAFSLGALRGRERGKLQAGGGGVIEDEFGEAAGAGDHRNSPPARPPRALTDRKHLAHFVEIAHFDRAMCLQDFGKYARLAREPPGVARDRALRALRASDLEHDDRLADGGRTVERGNVTLGLAHRLGKGRDHLGVGIVDEIVEIVDGRGHRLVARRNREAHAIAAQIREERDADRAALRHDGDIAREAGRVHHGLLVCSRSRRRIEDAHAVRTAHGHAGLAAKPSDLRLLPRAFLAELGEARIVDDGGARATLDREPHLFAQKRLADAEHDDVGRLRQIGQARIADEIADGRIFWIHRIDRSGKADDAE